MKFWPLSLCLVIGRIEPSVPPGLLMKTAPRLDVISELELSTPLLMVMPYFVMTNFYDSDRALILCSL